MTDIKVRGTKSHFGPIKNYNLHEWKELTMQGYVKP
jgi:hypothetical protein